MARENYVFLLGFVLKDPQVINRGDGDMVASCKIVVGRGTRSVGDGKRHMKCDDPTVLTNERAQAEEMATWHENDIVVVKGVLTVRQIWKGSYCSHCGERNTQEGSLVFVTPIACKKCGTCASYQEGVKFLAGIRELSNQVHVFGTLCRDPKKVKTKEGIPVTRYQIAMNRNFRIRTDAPEIKSDYPWVYSYGENATEDKKRLLTGAEVFIDGCLQARSVPRKMVCETCGKEYGWKDRAMEIVPYEVEYISGYLTDEMLEQQRLEALRNAKQKVFGDAFEEGEEDDEDDI